MRLCAPHGIIPACEHETERTRLDGIDFWRGCVLCMIFVDHMPGNAFETLTPRNFGFSDAAEAFVFLSGVSIALAYGRRFLDRRAAADLRGLGRRVLKLYGAHVGLSLAALAIFFAGAALAEKPDLVAVQAATSSSTIPASDFSASSRSATSSAISTSCRST